MNIKKFFYKITLSFRGLGLSKNAMTAGVVARMNHYFKSGNPEKVNVEGLIFYIDPMDSLCLTMAPYEPEVTAIFKKYITPNSVVADIGANIGYHTVFASRLAKFVIAFEPERRNFVLLKKNITVNNCDNVTAVNAAVSDVPGSVDLYVAEENRGGHSMVYGNEEKQKYGERTAISIPAVMLDNYLVGKQINFIKMDIEGAEGLALKGMLGILKM